MSSRINCESADLRGALKTPVAKSRAAVTDPRKVGELLRSKDTYTGQPTTSAALKLAPLVFVRPGELMAAYNQASYLDKRQEMMQAWADYLDGLKGGAAVISLQASPAKTA